MAAENQQLANLAEAILDSNNGPAFYEALAPYLNHQDFRDLGSMVELCPVHYCDVEICLDDKALCGSA